MGQTASCFGKGQECLVDVYDSKQQQQQFSACKTSAAIINGSKDPNNGFCTDDVQLSDTHAEQQQRDATAAAQDDSKPLDPTFACCLGAASQPGAVYDVSVSGPPLPGCEQERLDDSHLGELVEFAPKDELQNILSLVCNMFQVENALVSLFFDRRVYIIDGTGAFAEGDFPWRYSLCGWTMASERHCVMIVNDVTQDARFCGNEVAAKFNVRFYVGAPLVSSNGHRLGTLCFADSKPRVFDDSSLKLLCNFSELVTRALERDLLVAHHQQVSKGTGAELQEIADQKQKYRMMLRDIDCVNSAVLLVDTGTAGWAVRYANSGWHSLVQRHRQSEATKMWVTANAAAGAGSMTGPAAAAAGRGGTAALKGTDGVVGFLLFPAIERQLARDPDGGRSTLQQLQELLATRQPFSLHGLEMEGLGDTTVTLVFRSAGLSDIEGSVGVCVPSWIPNPENVPAAAAALQAGAADKLAPSTVCPPWQTLYFVTVSFESRSERELRVKLPGTQATTVGSFTTEKGRRNSIGSSCSTGRNSIGSSCSAPDSGSNICSSSITLSLIGAGQNQKGATDDSFMVLSRMSSRYSNSTLSSYSSGTNARAAVKDSTTTNATSISAGANNSSSGGHASSHVGSCVASIASGSAGAAARAVCREVQGLHVGGLIASGSYGRVYRGDYYGSTVAVKVLESDSVLRREAVSGLCLEALLGEKFRHPNIVSTLAWAVVTGKSKMAVGKRLWGETLDADRPSIAQNKAAIAAAAQKQQQQQLRRQSSDVGRSVSQQLPPLGEEEDSVSMSNSSNSSNSLVTAETWLVLEYCNKGCLQDAIDRGWLRDGPKGPVSLVKVIVTATEIAAGMYTLHKADVVHGDLSPYNVLLSGLDPAASEAGRGFVAKVSDFGLSRPMEGNSKLMTKTYGTITHMGPELLEHGSISKAVDVYSFGVLLWQMLASSRAWAGLSHHAVVHAVCVKKQHLQFPPEAPEALVDLGKACMSHDPEERPTFKDILDILMPLRDFVQASMAED